MSQAGYTDEFKTEAVGRVLERGYSVKEISERIGVTTYSLYVSVNLSGPAQPEF
jgi:transposase